MNKNVLLELTRMSGENYNIRRYISYLREKGIDKEVSTEIEKIIRETYKDGIFSILSKAVRSRRVVKLNIKWEELLPRAINIKQLRKFKEVEDISIDLEVDNDLLKSLKEYLSHTFTRGEQFAKGLLYKLEYEGKITLRGEEKSEEII